MSSGSPKQALLVARLHPRDGHLQDLGIYACWPQDDAGYVHAVLKVEFGDFYEEAHAKILQHVDAHPHLREWMEKRH